MLYLARFVHHLLPAVAQVVVLLSMSSRKDKSGSNRSKQKMKILCLHGKAQSGAIFRNKISGARRKLERSYDLHFLDGPILLDENNGHPNNEDDQALLKYAWWLRDERTGEHVNVNKAFEYVQKQIIKEQQSYDVILGFSQGGTLATALALTGIIPNVQAVVTAGAPHADEVFRVAKEIATTRSSAATTDVWADGLKIPKIHMAGELDAMISVDSTRALSGAGGNGILEVHDQGHLFPTRAARVNRMLEFLDNIFFEPPSEEDEEE